MLAIREPTFKAPTQGDNPLVRVDSPTDITFVAHNSPLLHDITWKTGEAVPRAPSMPDTLETWQQRGNEHFKASQWFLAALAYSYALALDPAAVAARLNRAEAYLKLSYYCGAQYDAQRILAMPSVPPAHRAKAIFRQGKTQYGRKQYADAERSFVQWQQDHVGDTAADPWIEKCEERQQELQTGQYNWLELYRTAQSKIRLDVADYVGPVEVSRMADRGGGRGVITTRDVQAGELLVCRAF